MGPVGETRVDLLHLLEDLRDAYPGAAEETILTEIVANAIDSGAAGLTFTADPAEGALTIVDDGGGMRRRDLARYHDVAATTNRCSIRTCRRSWPSTILAACASPSTAGRSRPKRGRRRSGPPSRCVCHGGGSLRRRAIWYATGCRFEKSAAASPSAHSGR